MELQGNGKPNELELSDHFVEVVLLVGQANSIEVVNMEDFKVGDEDKKQSTVSTKSSFKRRQGFESNNNKLKSTGEEDLNCKDFDEILEIVGSQGKFQKILLYAIVCPMTVIQPLIILNTIFLLFQPDHWCHVPGRDNSTDLERWKELHIPLDFGRPIGPDGKTKYSQCTMYAPNGSIVRCQMGWDYDRAEYESTMASELDWVCDKKEHPTHAFILQNLGNAVGTILFGHFADKAGRKPTLFITAIINVVCRLLSFYFAQHTELFFIMQFLLGTAFPVMYITSSMVIAEVCDKEYRAWVYSCTWTGWVVGTSLLPLIVWVSGSWFIIGLGTSLPGLVLLLYFYHVPESPRWLLSVGRLEESAEGLMRIAQCNGNSEKLNKSQLNTTLKRLHDKRSRESDAFIGVWTLFTKFRLAKNTLLLTVCWSINTIVYYGLTLNTTHMSGNQFVNFFVLSIIELPAGCGSYIVDKVGRRWTQAFFFFCCAFTCGASGIAVQYQNQPILEIVAVTIAKLAVTITYLVVYLQGAEIFPTQLRSTGSGFASTMAAAIGILGPIIVASGAKNLSYPYWIMGLMCFLGMVAASFLPETLNQNLPETVEDAEDFGKYNKFWSLYPKSVSKPGSVPDVVVQSVTAESLKS